MKEAPFEVRGRLGARARFAGVLLGAIVWSQVLGACGGVAGQSDSAQGTGAGSTGGGGGATGGGGGALGGYGGAPGDGGGAPGGYGGAPGDGGGAPGDGGGAPGGYGGEDPGSTCIPGDALDADNPSVVAESVLQSAEWTAGAAPPYDHPLSATDQVEVIKPAGAEDTAEFVIDYVQRAYEPDEGEALYFDFQAEALATSDRLARFAWRYDGRRAWHSPQTVLRVYADGPVGRTEVSVFEGFTEEYPELEGTVTLPLHAGYPFGISVFDLGINTLDTKFTLTTLETRPFDEDSPTPDPNAPLICPSFAPNEAPTLVLGPDLALDKDPPPYQSLRWAELAPGPASERGQTLSATLSITGVTGTLSFDQPPTLDVATGDLRFATTQGTYGTATVDVTLRDDGGTDDGGVDTRTGTFTIRVNSPPTDVHDVNIKSPWKQVCIPVTYLANDADPLDMGWLEFVTYPSKGFLDWTNQAEMIGGSPTYKYATTGCYVPFSSTYVGSDAYTFRVRDNHGGVSEVYSVSIEIFEVP